MKNLNKVLAMLVVFMMMVSTVAFAAEFTDVAEDSSYYTAIKVGTDLGLFVGYEDGSFAPEGEITRAEFAAIVVRMAGQEGQAAGAATTTPFTDVPDWAKGYVNIAAQKGIINGYGDGRFGSDDQVEYQDAITMMVRALGYEPAIGSAGYPTGYLTKAGELGLTAGVNGTNGVAINRGAVAQIVFNALDVALMTQSGYGTFTQYVVNDGFSSTGGTTNVKKTIMSENHDVFKIQGLVVSSTDATSSSKTNTPKVDVTIQNALRNKYSTDTSIGAYNPLGVGRTPAMEVADSDALDYVGKKCMLFVEYDEFEDVITIKSIYPANVADSMVIDIADLNAMVGYDDTSASNNDDVFGGQWKYYSSDDKISTITVSNHPAVFINGVNRSEINNLGKYDSALELKDLSGTVEFALLDTTNTDADYDTVYIEAADVFVVDELKASTSTIKNKLGGITVKNIVFDESDGDVVATLYDAEGAVMDWTDLQEFDVLSVKYIKTTQDKNLYTAEIIANKVEGTINSISGTKGADDRSVDIDGVSYDVHKVAETTSAGELKLADTGVFYLDANDNVIYFDATSRKSGNYAYVIATAAPVAGSMNTSYQMKLLTKDNEIIVYDVAKTFKYDDVSGVKMAAGTNTPSDANKTLGDTIFSGLKDTIITYGVNSSSQIVNIDTAVTATSTNREKTFTYESGVTKLDRYDPSDMTFGKYTLKDETVIFVIDTTDPNESEVVAIPLLEEDDEFNSVTLYDVDEDDYLGAIAVRGAVTLGANTEYATFVTKVSSSYDENGNDVIIVSGYQGLEEVSYTCEVNVINKPAVGDLVVPHYTMSGEVDKFFKAGDTVKLTNGSVVDRSLAPIYTLDKIDGRTLTFKETETVAGSTVAVERKIPASANVYVWDATSNAKIKYRVDESVSYIDWDTAYVQSGSTGLYRDDDDLTKDTDDTYKANLVVKVAIYYTDVDDIVDVVYYVVSK